MVQRWIIARLRHETFFSLYELNNRIKELLSILNKHPFKRLEGTRESLFNTIDKPALKPLPLKPYEYAQWKHARVNIDYHIEVDRHYYSVPYQLVGKQIDVRITARTVECLYKGNRIASHIRSNEPFKHTTVTEHMPKAHQAYAQWTPERLIKWAEKSGVHVSMFIERLLLQKPHPQHGFRSALGVMRLGKHYGDDRLNGACKRALDIGAISYRSIDSILKNGLDHTPVQEQLGLSCESIQHSNIRGSQYYQ